jgi:hypothetical protein
MATTWPIPWLPPVTIATFPFNPNNFSKYIKWNFAVTESDSLELREWNIKNGSNEFSFNYLNTEL